MALFFDFFSGSGDGQPAKMALVNPQLKELNICKIPEQAVFQYCSFVPVSHVGESRTDLRGGDVLLLSFCCPF